MKLTIEELLEIIELVKGQIEILEFNEKFNNIFS